MKIQQAISRLIDGGDLIQVEARRIMERIMSGENTDAQVGAYLTALHMKGETISEIAGSAQAIREKIRKIRVKGAMIDICGTGGDRVDTFNISTTAAFVVAGAGAKVAKQGDASSSLRGGSADLLKALGVNVHATEKGVARCVEEAGIGFLFLPLYSESMKYVLSPRNDLAMSTLLNLLGPLSNPADVPCQVMGVYDGIYTETLATVLGRLGSKRALVVHGMDGLDEMTTTNSTRVAELDEKGRVTAYLVEPEQFGLPRADLGSLRGGDLAVNVEITRAVLAGEKGPHRDIVVLNAGAALYISGLAESIEQGVVLAGQVIDAGKAREKLEQLVRLSHKS
ncbi:MAG: anthranilate phosphoribosyltransferase [Magnetococcales bacterium]|nr:anthranilate phosphoribosyltransferase [Magnetococcales bacterium]